MEQGTISFESSNGELLINEEDGSVNKNSDLSDWLLEVKKVDLEELKHYHKLNGQELQDCGDVLDFGWWDKSGEYHAPERGWREEIFHNPSLDEVETKKAIDESFKWIKINRNPLYINSIKPLIEQECHVKIKFTDLNEVERTNTITHNGDEDFWEGLHLEDEDLAFDFNTFGGLAYTDSEHGFCANVYQCKEKDEEGTWTADNNEQIDCEILEITLTFH